MYRRRNSIRLPLNVDEGKGVERRKRHGGFAARSLRAARRNYVYLCVLCVCIVYVLYALHRRYLTTEKMWPGPLRFGRGETLVFRDEDLRKVWKWEVAAGHYPSRDELPAELRFTTPLPNPARPKPLVHATEKLTSSTLGVGPSRGYFMREREQNHGYPPRPIPGSAADLDVVMRHCDFSRGKYVRDCLRVMREGAGLVNVPRRDRLEDEEYIYTEDGGPSVSSSAQQLSSDDDAESDSGGGFLSEWITRYEPPLHLPPVPPYRPHHEGCDENDPRIFHVFWNGPLTDKPYMVILSFLYTQNLGLHLPANETEPGVCRPQMWVWINLGPRGSTGSAEGDEAALIRELRESAWIVPFLHPRFQDAVKFKVWDTAKQLDNVPELRDDWRKYAKELLGTHPTRRQDTPDANTANQANASTDTRPRSPKVLIATGTLADYDTVTVKLSDLVRFVLCHTYGGTFLDADTLLLRDFDELWASRAAFAYRWSRLPRYNTAVLRMHRRSALGTLLLRTAVRNGLDFHPARVSRYAEDAKVEGLLWRLPDALFDPEWLGVEEYQRDRPAQPFFESFDDFFTTPAVSAAAPEALGFDGFFKGAYTYHYHNRWWIPFDPQRNFPDLGPAFSTSGAYEVRPIPAGEFGDLSWSTVLKRTFEAYIRGERPNMYGEWLKW